MTEAYLIQVSSKKFRLERYFMGVIFWPDVNGNKLITRAYEAPDEAYEALKTLYSALGLTDFKPRTRNFNWKELPRDA